jgi:esterase/lipase superfamily enzyme
MTSDPKKYGSDEVLERLRVQMAKERTDTLVFIHGYNNSFSDSLSTCAKLKVKQFGDHGRDINMFLFAWPSNGLGLLPNYWSDTHDARASAEAICRTFHTAVKFLRTVGQDNFCGQRLHLLAHSMGNYTLRYALRQIHRHYHDKPKPTLLDQVYLMAADEDNDSLELDHKLGAIYEYARRINVYYNRKDKWLIGSDLTKGNHDRLGCTGPSHPNDINGKFTLIDCSDLDHEFTGHVYYTDNSDVAKDMVEVMKGTPSDKFPKRHYVPETRSYRLERRK